MGGRGASSGMSKKETSIDSLPALEGSEKQVAWANQIRENAIKTIDANIASFDERFKKHGLADFKETVNVYKDLRERLFNSLNKEKSAATIIKRRNNFDPGRINFIADEMMIKKRNGK